MYDESLSVLFFFTLKKIAGRHDCKSPVKTQKHVVSVIRQKSSKRDLQSFKTDLQSFKRDLQSSKRDLQSSKRDL